MADTPPRFDHPPIVEAVLGIQFQPLPNFTSAHLGWYWKTCLGEEWSKPNDAPPLPDQFETFDEQGRLSPAGLQLLIGTGPQPIRLQVSDEAKARMVQVQATRFIYNWQKRQTTYPSYQLMRQEFDQLLDGFRRFVADAGLGQIVPNQWELIYVDHIPRGELWQSPGEWDKVVPALMRSAWEPERTRLKGVSAEWHYDIEPQRGRIHIALQHVRAGSPTGPEVLQIQTTARGPVRDEPGWDFDSGFRLGHDTVIKMFLGMTSPEAQRVWGKRDR